MYVYIVKLESVLALIIEIKVNPHVHLNISKSSKIITPVIDANFIISFSVELFPYLLAT